ncbi:phosphatidate cytidylyltransferase [Eremococcus coleocola]|uniref:Phosphatidate cytidylyltransferase n=1 Tax=Eremococcus coleocola ACS-139-V-Col8 TaxID=908337 RepID=E4KQD2_9LACT|nr:phosphatidate cytidylyltransferase [Eremococcus coleocola]EFR30834.1 phosphatidate cytidylyltransferase [Eremococcus coleocola ACS-139-V-Col8]
MKVRVRSALLGLAIFLPFIILGQGYFAFAIAVIGLVSLYELARMAQIQYLSLIGVISSIALLSMLLPQYYTKVLLSHRLDTSLFFYLCCLLLLVLSVFKHRTFNFTQAAILILGALYIGSGFRYLIIIRDMGLATLAFVFVVIWSTDIGAYLVGRKFGKHLLAPEISPKKTVEGMVGGTATSLLVSLLFLWIFPVNHSQMQYIPILIILISIFGQLGDLVESAYKRHYNVKDSGKILPGHGGFLDRFDSTLFASILMMVWMNLMH